MNATLRNGHAATPPVTRTPARCGVSRSNPANDRVAKVEQYAAARIPLHLLVDPLVDPYLEQLTLYADPAGGRYRALHTVAWGEKIDLPDPLPAVVDSSLFPSIEGRPGPRH